MTPTLIQPSIFLLIVTGVTLAALLACKVLRRKVQHDLQKLARQWEMHYSPSDVFNLADRIAPSLPMLGAADVLVTHLIYGNECDGHRYIFCAEYTAGAIRSKSRRKCVVSALEPKGRCDHPTWTTIKIEQSDQPLVEQYEKLKKEM